MIFSRRLTYYLAASACALTAVFAFYILAVDFSRPSNHFLLFSALLALFTSSSIGLAIYSRREFTKLSNRLHETELLAEMGNWERDIVTGKGYWSPARYLLFRMTPREKAPELDEFYALITPEYRDNVKSAVEEAIASKACYAVEYTLTDDPDHRVFCSRGIVISSPNGKPLRIVGTTQNVTSKKIAENALKELLRQRNLFIRRLGHDINTPLTPLMALLPLIREKGENPKQIEWIDHCIRSSAMLKKLVKNAMQLAKRSYPTEIRLVMTEIKLKELVDDILVRKADECMNHGLCAKNLIDAQCSVKGDISELGELFSLLLDNALKYTPCGAKMTIDARYEPDGVHIIVGDNGIGLNADECSQIFEEFYKSDPSRHEHDSSGLGLSIAKQIVINLGGRIWAQSRGAGEGTEIHFVIKPGGES